MILEKQIGISYQMFKSGSSIFFKSSIHRGDSSGRVGINSAFTSVHDMSYSVLRKKSNIELVWIEKAVHKSFKFSIKIQFK